MNRPGKNFERLITAIHNLESQDFEVQWDDHINGRQFDITIRFTKGLYKYLTVIECKDYKRSVPVKEVEAFITKSRSVKANKAIMVTSSAFQQGCKKVAKEHDIELLILKGEVSQSDISTTGNIITGFNIYNIRLNKSDGKYYELPKEPSGRLDFLVKNIKIQQKQNQKTLEQILYLLQLNSSLMETYIPIKYNFQFKQTTLAILPIDEGMFDISGISFKCKLMEALELEKGSLDIYVQWRMAGIYKLMKPDGTVKRKISSKEIKLGFDTVLKKNHFYVAPQTGFNYYCEQVKENEAEMVMVESYQHGQLLAGRFTMDIKHSYNYVEVNDEETIKRLENILQNLLKQTSFMSRHKKESAS